MLKPSLSQGKRLYALRWVSLVLVIGAVVATILVACLNSCARVQPSQEQLELDPVPENTPENVSEVIKGYNNPIIVEIAEGLMKDDEVFRQTLILETLNEAFTDQGQEPVLTEEDLPIVIEDEPVIEAMTDFIEVDDAYRNRVMALMISAMNTEQRQYIAKELQGDPALSSEEVFPLLPDTNGNYPNYHG